MLDYQQIKEYFPSTLAKTNPKGMLVEYLQYEFLDSLFKQPGSEELSFIGGTAIRLVHDSQRFSEDLDFDNFGLTYPSFRLLINKTCAEIKVKGFAIETKFTKQEKTYHCYVKFPQLLHQLELSGHREEKILLSVDTERKKKLFTPEVKSLNKFGVFRNITVNPSSVLLAQKLLAILYRPREKGRDFYDASFLGGKTKPDYEYVKAMTGLTRIEFSQKLSERCSRLNFKALAKDVAPFLFDDSQINRILNFKESLPKILAS